MTENRDSEKSDTPQCKAVYTEHPVRLHNIHNTDDLCKVRRRDDALCDLAERLELSLNAANERIKDVMEGQEALRQQTVRIRHALGDVPKNMDTEEAARRLHRRVMELENSFRHVFIDSGNAIDDLCKECGFDMQDKIHAP